MYYDRENQPIRSVLFKYQRWIIITTLVSPSGITLNSFALRRARLWSDSTSAVMSIVFMGCVGLCMVTVWNAGCGASRKRKIVECVSTLIHMCWINLTIGLAFVFLLGLLDIRL